MDEPEGTSWGPARWTCPAALAGMLAALAWLLFGSDPENRLVAAVLVVVCAVVGVLLLRIRVRLRVDSGGIVVIGPLHTRRIAWSQVSTISTPRRGRFGRRAAMLELEVRPGAPQTPDSAGFGQTARDVGEPGDLDDPEDELLTFGRFDLGADPAEVGRALLRHRP